MLDTTDYSHYSRILPTNTTLTFLPEVSLDLECASSHNAATYTFPTGELKASLTHYAKEIWRMTQECRLQLTIKMYQMSLDLFHEKLDYPITTEQNRGLLVTPTGECTFQRWLTTWHDMLGLNLVGALFKTEDGNLLVYIYRCPNNTKWSEVVAILHKHCHIDHIILHVICRHGSPSRSYHTEVDNSVAKPTMPNVKSLLSTTKYHRYSIHRPMAWQEK